MRKIKKINCFKIFFYTLFLLFINSCDNAVDNDVSIYQIANKPVVINSDFTYDPNPNVDDDNIDVKGPWFPVRFAGTNNSDKALTIATFVITAKGRTSDGTETESTFTLILPEGASVILNKIPAGEDFEMLGTAFIDGLPESRDNSYKISMKFQGWFNLDNDPATTIDESNQPGSSFEKTITFQTQ